MSGDTDKLAQIAACAEDAEGGRWCSVETADVLALVEIAKAARRLVDEAGAWEDGYTDALRAALSALDGDT